MRIRAILASILTSIFAASALAAPAAARPNFVLIVADDLGYADLGFTGAKDIKTPNLDRLAAEGTFFTDAYVTGPICVPSRMGIMIGRHQARWGVFNNNNGQSAEGQKRTAAEKTIAEFLKEAGYATALFGKWHLCGGRAEQRINEALPEKNGFDEVEMIPGGMSAFWAGTPLYRAGGEMIKAPEYLTDHFGKLASDFIRRKKDGPFFVALTFNAVHAPLHALDADKAANEGIADADHRTYAGMMSAMDRNIGRVLDTLRAEGIEKNTVVAFLSDNGGPAPDSESHSRNTASNGVYRGYKFDVWEGGLRSPMVVRWPDHIPAGKRYDGLCSSMDLSATFLAAAGIPEDKPLDGVNLLPFVNGERAGAPHEWLAWESTWFGPADAALRSGPWKIVQTRIAQDAPDPAAWELYNLADDPGESKNLAAECPERVQQLGLLYLAWRRDMADPVPGPRGKSTGGGH